MSRRRPRSMRRATGLLATVAVVGLLAVAARQCYSGFSGGFNTRAVGGVVINPEGVLSAAAPKTVEQFVRVRRDALAGAQKELQGKIPMRKVSLKRLNQALKEHHQKVPIPQLSEDMRYLGGLQRIQYILVYPEQNDIVLVGPGEGWKVSDDGAIVGQTTGRPVLLLDDLLSALRAEGTRQKDSISCSIDPSPEGIARLRAFVSSQRTFTEKALSGIEKALGDQTITVTGVPANTHFARVLVAADFRMKRLAMGFEKAPISGMPDYMTMLGSSPKGVNDMLPRWWLTTNYEPMHRDAAGLSWELRGQGVRCMSSTDFFDGQGVQKNTAPANPVAKKWADTMTNKYDALSDKISVFAELRNCMDLAVVSALIFREDLPGKAGLDVDFLLNQRSMLYDETMNPPRKVASQARAIRKGRGFLISASGGVEVDVATPLAKAEVAESLVPLRKSAQVDEKIKTWWAN